MLFRKKSTTLTPTDSGPAAGWLLLFCLLALSGCAGHPWGDIVSEQQSAELGQLYTDLKEQSFRCNAGFDGELVAQLDTQVENRSISGFFQIAHPSFLKLIVTNPLGQPVLILASDGSGYQVINTLKKTHSTVSLRSYSYRNEIPVSFLRGNWFAWLTGRPLSSDTRILEIRDDPEGRGVWFAIGRNNETGLPLEHVLLDINQKLIIERIVVEKDGSFQATMTYDRFNPIGSCQQPMSISVTGLSFGARAELIFSDMRPAVLQRKVFNLPYPSGYLRRQLP